MKSGSWEERYEKLSNIYRFVLSEYYMVLSALGYSAKKIDVGQLTPCRHTQDRVEAKNETKE